MKIIKRISFIVLICLIPLLVVGCDKEKQEDNKNVKKVHEHCARMGDVEGAEVSLEYDIYYTGDRLNMMISNEKITSEDQSILDTYEKSYKEIDSNYVGIKYYETSVTRADNSVLSYTKVDYDKVNINAIIDLEGEDDNIFENGIAKVKKWKNFAKKFGTTCKKVV